MIKFKICMLGGFAVGKTSLVRRFVHSIFSERYQTTLGVKIDRKRVEIDSQPVDLILWDLAGEDDFMEIRGAYLRGSAGGLLVADGTRADSLDLALTLKERLHREVGEVPVVLIVNKSDLAETWAVTPARLEALRGDGWHVIETSAKNDANVHRAFEELASRMIQEMDA